MNTKLIPWTIEIRALRTHLKGTPGEPVFVDVTIEALTPAFPASIDDCMDYQPVCRWLLHELPALDPGIGSSAILHALLAFVFAADARIERATVAMRGPGAEVLRLVGWAPRAHAAVPCPREADVSSQLHVVVGPVTANQVV